MTDKELCELLRDSDSYYRVQEKHWCIDSDELERQRLSAADRIEALNAEVARLREALEKIEAAPAWGYPERWETTPAEVRQIARAALGDEA